MNYADRKQIKELREKREIQRLHQLEAKAQAQAYAEAQAQAEAKAQAEAEAYSGSENQPLEIYIYNPPGHWHDRIGKALLSKDSYEKVLEQSIIMMQEEYFEAYSEGRTAYAAWIRTRFSFEFLTVLLLNLPLVKFFVKLT